MAMVDNNSSAITDGLADSTGAETPGERLRRARECAGLDICDVAKQLNLLPAQVRALEEGRYEQFPGDLYVKGHMRSYARLLKLQACETEEIVGCYCSLKPRCEAQPEPEQAVRPVLRQPLTLDGHKQRRYWGVVAAALVVLALWAWQQGRDHAELLPLSADGVGSELSALPGGIDNALADSDNATLLDSVQLLPNPAAPAPADAAAPARSGSAKTSESQAAEADIDRLSLHFTADCWVEIKDRDNKLLAAVLKHADDELKIEGRGPFKVLLGYAPGVEMAYNGTPVKVDVSDHSRSARLIVGNS